MTSLFLGLIQTHIHDLSVSWLDTDTSVKSTGADPGGAHPKDKLLQGRIQDFKLGGVYLKKLRQAEGGAKIFRVFRVKNHDFVPKNLIFFRLNLR
jgi:hypothetical protein